MDEPTENLYYKLTVVARCLQKKFNRVLQRFDLTPSRLGVLIVLWERDRVSIRAIRRRLLLDHATLSGLIRALERGGLVVRRENPDDRRETRVCLTQKGHEFRAVGQNLWKQFDVELGKKISPEDRRELLRSLDLVMRNVSRER
jgi:DNA-binding MarR family transcriptional regulator